MREFQVPFVGADLQQILPSFIHPIYSAIDVVAHREVVDQLAVEHQKVISRVDPNQELLQLFDLSNHYLAVEIF